MATYIWQVLDTWFSLVEMKGKAVQIVSLTKQKCKAKYCITVYLETCRKFTLRMLWICQFLLEVTDFAFAETPQEPEMKIQVIFHLLLHVFTDQMLDGRSSLGGKQADIQNWKRERSSWQLKRHCLRKQWQSYQRLRIYCCLYLLVTLFHPLFY